ncbi:initiator tRNA phosphoribosyl transferase, partial [Microstroma glucosiphilum]
MTQDESASSGSLYASLLRSDDRKVVRKLERDPWNRLRSIAEDSQWVLRVAEALPELPIIANLRCGAWYLSPELPQISRASTYCYFKSTDGHAGEWSFSLKRPNLDVVRLIQQRGGVIITDSTRRGKSLPDALSKTIPIWCAVLNEASRRRYSSPAHHQSFLRTPAHQVPPSEHAQIEARIGAWVEAVLASDLPVPHLTRPLVPFFLTRPRYSFADDCHPVVVLSASRRVDLPTPDPTGTYYYTQGSGDDEELWSFGLTPELFWDRVNHQRLLQSTRQDLPRVIEEVVRSSKLIEAEDNQTPKVDDAEASSGSVCDVAIGATGLFCGRRQPTYAFTAKEKAFFDLIIHCDAEQSSDDPVTHEKTCEPKEALLLRRRIPQGKKGLRVLQEELPSILTFVQVVFIGSASSTSSPRILIVDSTQKDLCLSVLIAILSLYYNSPTQPPLRTLEEVEHQKQSLTKDDVRRRLQWVVGSIPQANPSRSHLLRVNEVLMG